MKKLGILISGRGSNMLAIMDACEQGTLQAKVKVVIGNNRDSAALVVAQKRDVATVHLGSRTYSVAAQLDEAIKATLLRHHVDYVILAGFMKKIGDKTLATFKSRILNIHPSLLPRFGGQGMYGRHVHEAVLAAGEKESGVTIHLVDGDYDKGTILAQQSVVVETTDTVETLAARILKVEHRLYAETIQKIIDGNIILPNECIGLEGRHAHDVYDVRGSNPG